MYCRDCGQLISNTSNKCTNCGTKRGLGENYCYKCGSRIKDKNQEFCDFCGATDTRDNPVIAGDNACICKACVTAANEIMNGNYTNGGFLSSLDADEIKELFS